MPHIYTHTHSYFFNYAYTKYMYISTVYSQCPYLCTHPCSLVLFSFKTHLHSCACKIGSSNNFRGRLSRIVARVSLLCYEQREPGIKASLTLNHRSLHFFIRRSLFIPFPLGESILFLALGLLRSFSCFGLIRSVSVIGTHTFRFCN